MKHLITLFIFASLSFPLSINAAPPYKMMNGFEPLRISPHEIQLQAGSAAISTPNDPNIIQMTSAYVLDIRNYGVGGRDYVGAPSTGWHYIWLLYSTSTGESDAIMSKGELGGDLNIPAGYNRIRKLNSFAFYYNASTGIRRYVFSHWPNPFIYHTEADNGSGYRALLDGSSTSWTSAGINLDNLMAPSGRIVRVQAHVLYNSTAGSCYIRTPTLGNGIIVGSVDAYTKRLREAHVDLAVSSNRKIEYKCSSSDINLRLYVMGYSIQETY